MRTARTGLASLLLVAGLFACGSITPGQQDASGTAGVTGAGGTTGGSGTTAGTTGAAGRGGTTGGAGTTGAGGQGGSVLCNVICSVGRTCCNNACVNTNNDPFNCGACGRRCEGNTNLCSDGKCVVPECSPTILCQVGAPCCGQSCCGSGQLCCQANGPVSGGPPTCFTPTRDQPTCPPGCAPMCISDRDQKKNIQPADPAAVLDKVSRLPISTWSYRNEPDGVRHLGPMAQDFRAGFGLGDDDRSYFAVDAHGVALAAIQALDRKLAEQQKQIDDLQRENRELTRRLQSLDAAKRKRGSRER
jgi:hypothetical protein